ncbi:MAG: sulfatase-like hydrolase/transferase [Candidatus Sumerlaeota bacterium]|nr:sulfatase-like hydrolase/transferase [Candidatus Sumerlaeota bacterium]
MIRFKSSWSVLRASLFVFIAASAFAAEQPSPSPAKKPNVLLIFVDDLGAADLHCYGSEDLSTPNCDALAGRGVRFTQFYVAASVCSPSRAALLTGRYPLRAGLASNAGGGKSGLPLSEATIAEMLRGAGYRTAIFGKWHLGASDELSPLAQGFDEFFGHREGCIDNYSHFYHWSGPIRHDLWRDNQEVWEDGKFFGDLIVREAERFLDESKDRPFFLYFPVNEPHYPKQAKPQYREMYKDMPLPRGDYAAFVSTMDELVGRVMAKVDSLGLRQNTLVIFESDNGHSTESRNNYGGGNPGPYRGAKYSFFEGGTRLPAIASLPGRIPEGEVRDQMGCAVDWLPTIAELCGAPLPDRQLDGVSLWPVLESATAPAPHTTLHWQLTGTQWAVHDGDWKLVANGIAKGLMGDNKKLFLSNLAEDVGEMHNLAKEHPEIVERLTALHDAWLKDVRPKAPKPAPPTGGKARKQVEEE